MKFLSDQTAGKLTEFIKDSMSHRHFNTQGAVLRCQFCGSEADSNYGEMGHRIDCQGYIFLQALNGSDSAGNAALLKLPEFQVDNMVESG